MYPKFTPDKHFASATFDPELEDGENIVISANGLVHWEDMDDFTEGGWAWGLAGALLTIEQAEAFRDDLDRVLREAKS